MISLSLLIDRLFHRTILLRPTAEGVLEPIDITGQDAVFLNQRDAFGNSRAIVLAPTRIYPVRGLRGINKLCVHFPNTTQLLDLYHEPQIPSLSETMLADLLDINYQKGVKEGAGSNTMNEGLSKYLKIIMVASIAAALLGVISYFK